jgi:hypothetical protein
VNIHSLLLRAPKQLDAIIAEIVLEKSEFEKNIGPKNQIGTLDDRWDSGTSGSTWKTQPSR